MPGDVDDEVERPLHRRQPAVLTPIDPDEFNIWRRIAREPARRAHHLVPAIARLPCDLPGQEPRTTQNKCPHPLILTHLVWVNSIPSLPAQSRPGISSPVLSAPAAS